MSTAPLPKTATPDPKQVLLVNEMNARANLLSEARHIYGREAAMSLWDKLGLPDIAGDGVNEAAGTPADDPEGCLKHLISFTCGQNLSVRVALACGLADEVGARRMEQLSIKIRPQATRTVWPSPMTTNTSGKSSASLNGTATGNSPSKS
jgi:hypothetical protein